MATMMIRAFSKAGIETTMGAIEMSARFDDHSIISEYAVESIYFMSANDLIKGVGNNLFNPKGNATREQALLISERSAEKLAITNNENSSSQLILKQFGDLEYYLYIPNNPTNEMPLIIYFHGATFKNLDISELLNTDGFPKYLNDGYYGDLRAYVVIPKIDEDIKNWEDISDTLKNLIQTTNKDYNIDLNKVSLTGHSIGGTGTYQVAIKLSNTFSCIAPMSGFVRNTDENISALSKIKVWAFVGTNDTVISPNSSKQAVKHIKSTEY